MKISLIKYREILSKSRYILLLNITDRIFSFIIMLLFARTFVPELYGQLVTLFTFSIVFVSIVDLGIPIYLQREIAMKPENGSEIFSITFTAGILLFSVYFISAGIAVRLIYPEISFYTFTLISALIYAASLVTMCNKALSGIKNFRSQFIAFLIPRILIAAVFLAGIYVFAFGMDLLVMMMLSGFALNLLIVLYFLHISGIKYSVSHFSFSKIGVIWAASIPLGLTVIFNLLYDKLDVLLISKISGFTETAYYNVGYGLYKSSAIAFSFLLVSAFTEVSAFKKDKAALRNFLREYSALILSICLAAAVLLYFLSGFIITNLYTIKFQSSVSVLQILVIGIIAMGMNNLTGIMLNGMGYYKVVMYITLYGLIFNVSLNALFIPAYGIIAASVITVLTEYIIFFTEYYYLKKILKS